MFSAVDRTGRVIYREALACRELLFFGRSGGLLAPWGPPILASEEPFEWLPEDKIGPAPPDYGKFSSFSRSANGLNRAAKTD